MGFIEVSKCILCIEYPFFFSLHATKTLYQPGMYVSDAISSLDLGFGNFRGFKLKLPRTVWSHLKPLEVFFFRLIQLPSIMGNTHQSLGL